MKRFALLTAGLLTLGVVGSASAHKGPLNNVFQWPAGKEPTLDGDLSEWSIIPEDYFIGPEKHFDIVNGQGFNMNPADLSIRCVISWSQGTNRLYYSQVRFDDYYDRNGGDGAAGGDDSWEVAIDSDHGGESIYVTADEVADEKERELAQGRWAQTSHDRFPPLPPFGWKWFWMSTSTWHDQKPWADYGFKLDGQLNDGEATAYIEIMSAAWDDFNFHGPELSVLHTFKEGEIIGLGWGIIDHDADTQGLNYDAWWGYPGDGDQWRTAATIGDWFLAPVDPRVDFSKLGTAVESESWGRIKAAFVQ